MSGTDFSLHYPFDAVPEPGGFLEIRPSIFWLRIPLPGSLDHLNLWLLDAGGSWVLVDTGLDWDAAREAWNRIASELVRDKPVSRIIVTHFHPDHIGLAGYLGGKFGARIAMTRMTALRTRHLLDSVRDDWRESAAAFCRLHGIRPEEQYLDFITGQGYRTVVSRLLESVTVLDHDRPVAIGDHAWQPLVVNGHAEEHLALYCPDLELLISGDQVLPAITSNIAFHVNNEGEDPLAHLEYLHNRGKLAKEMRDGMCYYAQA